MVFVYSTLTHSYKYPIWLMHNNVPKIASSVTIQGGANLPSKQLVTPKGVLTTITDEQYDRLQQNKAFQRHLKANHLKVETQEYAADDVAKDMEPKDGSAPMTPADYEDDGLKPPTVGSIAPDMQNEVGDSLIPTSRRRRSSIPAP